MKQIAVAIIHGMGSQGREKPENSSEARYSKEFQKRLRTAVGADSFDKLAVREILWADILQDRQERYLGKIKRRTRYDELRAFVLCNLSDAAAYRKNGDQRDDTYERIHERVSDVIAELEQDCGPDAPLVVIAHSLGGHILSNHIYDMTKPGASPPSNFQGFRTLAGFITFGCNIPLFTFSYDQNDIKPISFPGTNLPVEKRFKPWWLNFYDKDDVLGYPLKDIGEHYEAMVDSGDIKDTSIDAGGLFTSWNPASHNAYWRDEDFYRPVAKFLKKLL
ncbi:MAG: hypothetical protein AAFX86_08850 [Pseudomonadota bacterium]